MKFLSYRESTGNLFPWVLLEGTLTSGLLRHFSLTYRIENISMSLCGGTEAMQMADREPDLASSPECKGSAGALINVH